MLPPQGSPLLCPIHCPSLHHPDHPTILNTMFSSSGKSWKNTAFIIKSYSRQSCLQSQLNVTVSLNTALFHLHPGDHKQHKPSAKYWCLVPCLCVSWFRSWIIDFLFFLWPSQFYIYFYIGTVNIILQTHQKHYPICTLLYYSPKLPPEIFLDLNFKMLLIYSYFHQHLYIFSYKFNNSFDHHCFPLPSHSLRLFFFC